MESLLYFLLWAGLFLVLMRFGCGAHVMGHRHGQYGAHDKHAPSDPNEPKKLGWVAPESVVDPVCGKTVKTAESKSSVHDGAVYYFCSRDCRERFEVAPHFYVGPQAEQTPKAFIHGHG